MSTDKQIKIATLKKSRFLNKNFLAGGGEMGALMRQTDWGKTPVGPVETWPKSLQSTIRLMLDSKFGMFLWWGPELVQFYNDTYRDSFGTAGEKHPQALGQRGKECWGEIWDIIYPQIETVMTKGIATLKENHLVPIYRNGILEEVYWTYTYTPVHADSGKVGGVLVIETEVTKQVIGERRSKLLRELAISMTDITNLNQVFALSMQTFEKDASDIPFALLYLRDKNSEHFNLVAYLGLDKYPSVRYETVKKNNKNNIWPIWEVIESGKAKKVIGLEIKKELWPEYVNTAYVLPIIPPNENNPIGTLIVGINPRNLLNQDYKDFLESAARQLVVSISNASAHEMKLSRQNELEKARQEAENARERLYNLFVQTPVPIAIFRGPKFVIELANPPVCEFWGKTIEELINKPLFEALPEAKGQGFEELLEDVLKTGKPFQANEVSVNLMRKGKMKKIFFNFVYQPLYEVDETISGVVVIANEITEQVLARHHIEEAGRQKDNFIGVASHELKTPLTSIKAYSQILHKRFLKADDLQSAKLVEKMDTQLNKLNSLVSDLLDVTKIEAGQFQFRQGEFDVNRLISEIVEEMQRTTEKQRIIMKLGKSKKLYGNKDRIGQCIINFLSNAIKYSPESKNIIIKTNCTMKEIRISVQDFGVGMSKADQEKVFERFYRVGGVDSETYPGLGLGLYISSEIIKRHNGKIWVESSKGKGSTFSFSLPLKKKKIISTSN